MFGPAQAAVARAVVDSVESGVIPKDKADDLCVMVGVFIHWEASRRQEDLRLQLPGDQGIDRARAGEQAERRRRDRGLEDGEASVQPEVSQVQVRGQGPAIRAVAPPRLSVREAAPPARQLPASQRLRSRRRLRRRRRRGHELRRRHRRCRPRSRARRDLHARSEGSSQHRHLHRRHRHGGRRAAAGRGAEVVLRSDARVGDARLERIEHDGGGRRRQAAAGGDAGGGDSRPQGGRHARQPGPSGCARRDCSPARAPTCVITSRRAADSKTLDGLRQRFGGAVQAAVLSDASQAAHGARRRRAPPQHGPGRRAPRAARCVGGPPGLRAAADVNAVPPLGHRRHRGRPTAAPIVTA